MFSADNVSRSLSENQDLLSLHSPRNNCCSECCANNRQLTASCYFWHPGISHEGRRPASRPPRKHTGTIAKRKPHYASCFHLSRLQNAGVSDRGRLALWHVALLLEIHVSSASLHHAGVIRPGLLWKPSGQGRRGRRDTLKDGFSLVCSHLGHHRRGCTSAFTTQTPFSRLRSGKAAD